MSVFAKIVYPMTLFISDVDCGMHLITRVRHLFAEIIQALGYKFSC